MTTPLEAIKASLPPATDPLTFLSILEYNLKPELLPELHKILQDAELTANIGWDLISLLTPLLPASTACLQEVARLGNPRECVLKTTEVLRQIDFDEEAVVDDDDEDDSEVERMAALKIKADRVDVDEPGIKGTETDETDETEADRPDTSGTAARSDKEMEGGQRSSDDTKEKSRGETEPSLQDTRRKMPLMTFTVLLSLLSIIHPRIQSSKPSRFLSSTLQAILATYTEASRSLPQQQIDELTAEITRFIKTVSGGKKRPHLPPRKSTQDALPAVEGAPDPEGHDETPSETELALTARLLQSFTTHILEDYCLALDEEALSWSARYQEKTHPKKVVRGRPTTCERYIKETELHARDSTVGQLIALAQDLDLENEELRKTLLDVPAEPAELDGPPTTPADIPLSSTGALLLLTSRITSSVLFDTKVAIPAFSIFPDHATLAGKFLGVDGAASTGSEPVAISDAVTALGLWSFATNQLGDISAVESEAFNGYLQSLSLLSANHPSPPLRYAAHTLCSSVLHAHPSDTTRLSFIHDTLEHCPYETLKGSAVAWLKTETLSAFDAPTPDSVFSTPLPLSTLAPYLFPSLAASLGPSVPLVEAWTNLKAGLSFYLSTLNFLYLLLSAERLTTALHVKELNLKPYLDVLGTAQVRFKTSLTDGGEGSLLEEEGGKGAVEAELGDLALLSHSLAQVGTVLEPART